MLIEVNVNATGGKLYVVGLGPGAGTTMTARARAALQESQLIVGYTAYIDLLRREFAAKELVATPMRTEIDRCREVLAAAAGGRIVSLVCSGDAGVYGMAGPVFELAGEFPPVAIEVVPGVSAANGAAALLGAPLMHDWCCVSLSDLLTPWETIERRLRAAVAGDFVVCLYNPASRNRPDHLRRACDVLLDAGASPRTVCGLARNVDREGEQTSLCTLTELRSVQADMFTSVIVGNSQTHIIDGRMVTPRGYRHHEGA